MCRAFLSPWWNKEGKEVYTGRFNIGAITLNLPGLAIQSDKDFNIYFGLIDKYFDLIIQTHLFTYNKLSKVKAASNPLFFCEGGCAVQLNHEDTIEEALKCATASIGYIGLEEACYFMTGKHLHENAIFGEMVLEHLNNKIEEACEKYDRLFALYGSPSEGLCDKMLRGDLAKYGVIEGVTDKEWYTNSHHIDVRADITSTEKLEIESSFFKYAKGGRIGYTEWSNPDNFEAMLQQINYAMKLGFYYGINFENSTCMDCGAKGDFKDGKCPICGSDNVTVIDRVCGLTY